MLLRSKCSADPNTLVVDVGGNIGYFALYRYLISLSLCFPTFLIICVLEVLLWVVELKPLSPHRLQVRQPFPAPPRLDSYIVIYR